MNKTLLSKVAFSPIKNIPVFLFIYIIIIGQSPLKAQTTNSDFNLLIHHQLPETDHHTHITKFGITQSNNAFVKYNPVTLTLSSVMFMYQKWVSPQISSNCYYQPTCSRYGVLLFKEFGLIKGTLATADRMMRCDRISATTFNPLSINPADGKIHETTNRYRFNLILHNE